MCSPLKTKNAFLYIYEKSTYVYNKHDKNCTIKDKLLKEILHKMISKNLKRFLKLHCLNPNKLKSYDKELCINSLYAYILFKFLL